MPNPEGLNPGKGVQWIVEQWCEKLAEVITSMTQGPAGAVSDGQPVPELPEGSHYYEIPLSAGSSLIVAAPEPAWMGIGGAALQAVGLDEADAADTRSTYIEILVQATSGLAGELSKKLGKEVTCLAGRDSGGAAIAGLQFYAADLTLGAAEAMRLYLAPAMALAAAVEEGPQPTGQAEPDAQDRQALARAMTVPDRGEDSFGKPDPLASSKTLDLLLEVELPVSVSFGKTELLLRDVLKLTSGSIVEMSRTTNEPVDVIVNNTVIARGDVVVVDGNYGVRISKISSLRERLRVVR